MRLILTLLLLTLAAPAWAEWVKFGSYPHGDAYYYDPTTIENVRGYRRVWMMVNYAQQEQGVHSARVLREFDCKEDRSRFLRGAFYSEAGLAGEEKINDTHEQGLGWHYDPPTSAFHVLGKIVCK